MASETSSEGCLIVPAGWDERGEAQLARVWLNQPLTRARLRRLARLLAALAPLADEELDGD